MKYAALIFAILALGACPTAPNTQNFLDKLAGQSSLKINEWDGTDQNRTLVTNTFSIQNGGRLFVKDTAPTITLRFVKELGNYVAQYIYYEGATEKGVRYFTAVGGQIFISEALPDSTPAPAPDTKNFLDKVKDLATIKIDGYNYTVSDSGTNFTDGRYQFRFEKNTGDYSAAYGFYIDTTLKYEKIFSWKNGYYISETVDFKP